MNAVYSNVTAVTYDFYSLPFCSHEGKARVDESLGEWFLGGRIRGAPFSFTFLVSTHIYCIYLYDMPQPRGVLFYSSTGPLCALPESVGGHNKYC